MNDFNSMVARLNAKLDNLPAAKQDTNSSYEASVVKMRAEHQAAKAEMDARFAKLEALYQAQAERWRAEQQVASEHNQRGSFKSARRNLEELNRIFG